MRSNNQSRMYSPKLQVLDKGNILTEINRLKNLERHHQRINDIQNKPLKKVTSLDQMDRMSQLGGSVPTKVSKQNFKKECKSSEHV